MTRAERHGAQDAIMNAIVQAAGRLDERGDDREAEAIRILATRIAKQYGLSNVPGLPGTYPAQPGA
jgi:hypothetical protein